MRIFRERLTHIEAEIRKVQDKLYNFDSDFYKGL
jgi:hypothetical protein